MRPIPRTRHLLVLLIFAAASAAAGYFALLDDRMSDTQVNIAAAAVKRHQTDLFAHDPVFGHDRRWRFQTPAVQIPLELMLVPTDYQDLALPFQAMTGVFTMIYLAGMYALLYRQCRSWSVSTYVSLISSTVIYTLGRSFWGIGSLSSITPAAMVIAVVPLIVLSYLRYENQWRVLLVFAFIGLCANIHLVTAMNLAIVMLIVFLGRHRFAPSCWPTAIGCVLCVSMAALPYAAYYLHLRYSGAPDALIEASQVQQALRLGGLELFYPEMLKSLVYWLLFTLVLLIPAAAVLSRVERFRVRDLAGWAWMAAGSLLVCLGLHGASQLVGILTGKAPPIADFAQASNLVMLPLYVLFAQALTNLFRLMRPHKVRLRWALAAFLAAWMIPSDNIRVPRHIAYDLSTSFMAEDRKPLRVQELHARAERIAELANIANWAKSNTPTDSVFLIDSAKFRMLSRRAIAATRDDARYFYYVTPWQLGQWRKTVTRQRLVLRPPSGKASDVKILEFIQGLTQGGLAGVENWYVILRAAVAPDTPGALSAQRGPGCGKHYRLYRAG